MLLLGTKNQLTFRNVTFAMILFCKYSNALIYNSCFTKPLPCTPSGHNRCFSRGCRTISISQFASRTSNCRTVSQNCELYRSSSLLHASSDSSLGEQSQQQTEYEELDINIKHESHGGWISLGISAIYLAHFTSIYTQLPGLFSESGLLPVTRRLFELETSCWILQLFPNPEFGMELFAALGILISVSQIVMGPSLRNGWPGMITFALQWIFWHDLVFAGGRFTSYQMDFLVLDAAPLAIIGASGLVPSAVTFGYRWLLTRLYLGAGAVKLLSCDPSWRDLSAVHWHFQSQPLPNILGDYAYQYIPNHPIGEAITLFVLVVEMAAPFLFLAPSKEVRRVAFVLNIMIMVGIALFGNFGPLQALLLVIGIALLEEQGDLPPVPGIRVKKEENPSIPSLHSTTNENAPNSLEETELFSESSKHEAISKVIEAAVTGASLALAAGGAIWTFHDVGATCSETWGASPLVYDAILLGAVSLVVQNIRAKNFIVETIVGIMILLGSTVPLAKGLAVAIPFAQYLDVFNIGANSYGLFAIMTGADGFRPTLTMEVSSSLEGPWTHIPFLYQINDPKVSLPLCFPHFPRFDWTLWFLPLGENGGMWLRRFMHGISIGDPTILSLINAKEFYSIFPEGQAPEFIKLTPQMYTFDKVGSDALWVATNAIDYDNLERVNEIILSREELQQFLPLTIQSWPSLPLLRPFAEAIKPEYFIWTFFAISIVGYQVIGSADNAIDIEAKPDDSAH